jgi:scyllo-inositol 2-dehydrogenase (NADP+)
VAGISDSHADRAAALAKLHSIPQADVNPPDSIAGIRWLDDVDALVIATPPLSHGTLVNQALALGKHVLVEKPYVVNLAEGESAINEAERRGLILCVNHNFQFSRGFTKLTTDLESTRLGTVRGIYSLQLSNDTRRLPAWSETLPLGLFYDESPHVFYLVRRYAGEPVSVRSVFASPPSDARKTTPHALTLELTGLTAPASIHIDFESPICEWFFAVLGDRGIGFVDLFRDIYSYLPNDGRHLMREVFTTSGLATLAHWKGFLSNGWAYVRHSLFYGFDAIYKNFATAIESSDPEAIAAHSASAGLAVNRLQRSVVQMASYSKKC